MARMKILSTAEQAVFDTPPLFNHLERKQFFDFPKTLLDRALHFRHPVSQVGFLISCGYFKATKRFFYPIDYHPRDIAYVSNQLATDNISTEDYPDRTRQRHQKIILEFHGFKPFDKEAEAALATEINTMATTYLKPKLILDRCVDFLIQKRLQVPKSWALTELIRSGMQLHKSSLVELMDNHLTNEARLLLDDLFTTPDDQSRYRLTILKKLSQSTKPSQVKESIADFDTLSILYGQLDAILDALKLGHAGIRYFSGSVLKSEIFQIQRRETNDRYIHARVYPNKGTKSPTGIDHHLWI